MPKTPQVPAPWKTGIYIGNGVVAEDKPEPGKQYRLIGRTGEPSIYKGNTWQEAEINNTTKEN